MSVGLQYVLGSKLSEGPRISVISYETGPSIFLQAFVEEVLSNCLDAGNGNNPNPFHVHYLNFVCKLGNSSLLKEKREDVTIYDFSKRPCVKLETLCHTLVDSTTSSSSKLGKNHVIIVDDFCLFSILSSGRDMQLQSRFLRLISKRFRKMYIFFHKDTLSAAEIGSLYDNATDIAFVQLHPESNANEVSLSSNKFTCDHLKLRPDRRVTHDRTIIQIVNGEIKEELDGTSGQKSATSEADLLKNLTTFKLTLEEGERESKNKLNLPYFEAQKTALEDPENFDDDFDEEDEEV